MPHLIRASRRTVGAALGIVTLLLLLAPPGHAETSSSTAQEEADALVEILPLEGLLDPPTAGAIIDLVNRSAGSDLVVIQLDAPGAVSVDIAELVEVIQSADVPVAIFVGPQGAAASLEGAGVALLAAAHVVAAASDATIGPAHPLELGGGTPGEAEAALREAGIEDAALLEALVGSSTPAGDLAGLVDLDVPGLEALLLELDSMTLDTADGPVTMRLRSDEVAVRFHTLGITRRLLHAATTGPFIYLLLTMGLGMLLFELFQPGFGVAGIAGVLTVAIGAFGLTVLPVTWWAVALVVIGMVLFAVDTAIAGFGPVTAGAVASLSVGSVNFYGADALDLPWWLVAGTVITAFVFFVFVMTSLLRAQAGPAEEAVAELIGRRGVVRSVLNPEGHVFVDGALWRARWADETHAAKVGTVVKVTAIDGPLVLVDAVDAGQENAANEPADASNADETASSS